jgi:tetratricopeptide (TPR) repeat protein
LSLAATVHAEAGDVARATQLLREAERLLDKGRAEMPGQQAVLERRLAQMALQRGDHAAAVALAQRAAAREDDMWFDRNAALQVLLVLAEAENEHRNFDAAAAAAERALAMAASPVGQGRSSWVGQAHLELGIARAGQGNLDAGRSELAPALDHLEACAGGDARPTRRARAQLARLGR